VDPMRRYLGNKLQQIMRGSNTESTEEPSCLMVSRWLRLVRLDPGSSQRDIRALTLLETSVVAALTGVLLAFVARWVIGLLLLVGAGSDGSGPGHYARVAQSTFQADVAAATVCHPVGIGSPVGEITPDSLHLSIDSTADGTADTLVHWAVLNGQLLRGTTPLEDCNVAAGDPTWTVIADEVAPRKQDAGHFATVTDGVVTVHTDTDCGDAPQDCRFNALVLEATLTLDDEAPNRIRVTVEMTTPYRL
jgi:hypothetical protein